MLGLTKLRTAFPSSPLDLSERLPTTTSRLVAYIELPPAMARQVAQELLDAAEAVDDQQRWKSENI